MNAPRPDGAHAAAPFPGALLDPRVWPDGAAEVELVETHISWIFLTGAHAYKVKKPVAFAFLDFSTFDLRRAACLEELRLNRRLSPDMYLGLSAIVRDSAAGALRVLAPSEDCAAAAAEAGLELVECCVTMRRLPAERMLARLCERGEIDNALLAELADRLAGFHLRSATGQGVDEFGAPAAVQRNALENFDETRAFRGAAVSHALHAFLEQRARDVLAEQAELFARRVASGRIREGHGDLHAENICCEPGKISIYDAIEFSPRFRCGDVAADLAFLAMDLDARGFPAFARFLAHRYALSSGDAELRALLPFYKGYRAVVRAKVAALAAQGASDEEARASALGRARGYFHLAAGYELPPALLLLCGLPATGKTSFGRHLALPLCARLISTDVERKLLAGLALRARSGGGFRAGLYSPERTRATYGSVLRKAVRTLLRGASAIVDANFPAAAQRRPFCDAAARLGVPWIVVHCTADEATVRARLAARSADPRAISDADLAVYEKVRAVFEPPDEVPAEQRVDVATEDGPLELRAAPVFDALVRSLGP